MDVAGLHLEGHDAEHVAVGIADAAQARCTGFSP